MKPQNIHFPQTSTWGKHTFKLHLLCEHEKFHFCEHEGYTINDPKPFLRTAGRAISWTLQLLVMGSSLTFSYQATAATSVALQNISNLGERPTKYFKRMTNILERLTDLQDEEHTQPIEEIRGPALRELERKLRKSLLVTSIDAIY